MPGKSTAFRVGKMMSAPSADLSSALQRLRRGLLGLIRERDRLPGVGGLQWLFDIVHDESPDSLNQAWRRSARGSRAHRLARGEAQAGERVTRRSKQPVRDLQSHYIGVPPLPGRGRVPVMTSTSPSISTRTASGATPGRAAMIQSCRSVSKTSIGGSQRAVRPPSREGSKNCRWQLLGLLQEARRPPPTSGFSGHASRHLGQP